MNIIVSKSTDPVFNLALEERIFNTAGSDVLLLYRNSPAVVVGRNQNPEAEADISFCRNNDIPVIKRISGGGTVYHDTGNINYSFITDTGDNLLLDSDFLTPVIKVLEKLDIKAVQGKRKELLLGGKKISGTAAHVKRGKQMFHGTLLYDTDLSVLETALRGDASKRGKRVASVSSPVTNIIDHMQKKEPVEEFFHRLVSAFTEFYGVEKADYHG